MGGTCIPLRGAEDIMWTVQFRNGEVKRFKFPIRTTVEGSIKPFDGKPEPAIWKANCCSPRLPWPPRKRPLARRSKLVKPT